MKADILYVPLFLTLVCLEPAHGATAHGSPAHGSTAHGSTASPERAPAPSRALPAASVRQDDSKIFRDSFAKAMGLGSREEMRRLVARNTDEAIDWIIQTAEAIGNSPNDKLYDLFNALREAWKASIKTDFCDKMERYFSLMDPPTRRERMRMRVQFNKQRRLYIKNLEAKDLPTFTKMALEFESLAEAFTEVGDHYYASLSWSFMGNCYDESNLGNKADLKKATAALGHYIESCDKIGLDNKLYKITTARLKTLIALGFGEGGSVAKAPAVKPTGEPAGESAGESTEEPTAGPVAPTVVLEATMTFELIDDIAAIQRPNYALDELYPMWSILALQGKGSQVAVPRLEGAPNILRVAAAEARVDVDRDGIGDVRIPIRGRIEPVVFSIGEGDSKREWALLTQVGIQKDTYQAIEMNLEPSAEYLNIYVVAAGSVVGELDGTRIQVIDDNIDGIYGSPPSTWGNVGMSPGSFQPEMDSMVIGKSKRAVPWSEFTMIGDVWYQLEPTRGGMQLAATPVTLRTGFLKLKYKGPRLSYMVVKGANDFENSYFDISSGKPVEVPLGRYTLFFGMLSKGKKKQIMKSLVIPGEDTPTWDLLEEGGDVTIELGAPFGFDFTAEIDDREILVTGNSVVVVGRGGERYERVWGAVPRPAVSYRKAGSKRGTKPEDMDRIMDQDQITQFGWASAWFPRDIVLQRRGGAKDIEVQLTEKKNKLFGKIESVWK